MNAMGTAMNAIDTAMNAYNDLYMRVYFGDQLKESTKENTKESTKDEVRDMAARLKRLPGVRSVYVSSMDARYIISSYAGTPDQFWALHDADTDEVFNLEDVTAPWDWIFDGGNEALEELKAVFGCARGVLHTSGHSTPF